MPRDARTPVADEQKAHNLRISKEMPVTHILTLLPGSEPLLARHGLHCFSCPSSEGETLEEGCMSHGFSLQQIDDVVADLNVLLEKGGLRPNELFITKDAALALNEILVQDGKSGRVLVVALDENGGFCMETKEHADGDHRMFFHPEVPELRIAATALSLNRIGGATIDLRDGRFKLDLPEDKKRGCACGGSGHCACKNGGECGCGKIN